MEEKQSILLHEFKYVDKVAVTSVCVLGDEVAPPALVHVKHLKYVPGVLATHFLSELLISEEWGGDWG